MNKESFDIIYSIGVDCACATYLKRCFLRSCAGPFDWLTSADFSTRINCIVNDFETFFNKEDLELIAHSSQKTQNFSTDDYKNTRNNFVYFHDFKTNVPFEKEYIRNKNKYNRRIKRFYDNIQSKDKVLLIYHAHQRHNSDEVYQNAYKQLQNKFGKDFKLVIIENNFDLPLDEVNEVRLADNLIKYELVTEEKNDKGEYTNLGNVTNCLKIYSKFSLNKSSIEKFKEKSYILLLKILAKTTPLKRFKRILKEYYCIS